jgi:SOS-response transcriptional repressor LexA
MSYGQRIRDRREHLKLSQLDVATFVGVTYQSVQQWEADQTQPQRKYRARLAEILRTSEIALEFGYQMNGPSVSEPNVGEGPPIARMVPLISWVRAGAFDEVVDPYQLGDAEAFFPIPRRAGPRTFALRVRGASMEPYYHDGDIIFVDPDVDARQGSRVIVRLEHEKEATFKELVVEGDQRYLKALNPAWPESVIKLTRDATIIGVVIPGKWVPE